MRSIPQGCPLSCLRFIITVELLEIKLRSDTRKEGINISRQHMKIAQLVDDTTQFLNLMKLKWHYNL